MHHDRYVEPQRGHILATQVQGLGLYRPYALGPGELRMLTPMQLAYAVSALCALLACLFEEY